MSLLRSVLFPPVISRSGLTQTYYRSEHEVPPPSIHLYTHLPKEICLLISSYTRFICSYYYIWESKDSRERGLSVADASSVIRTEVMENPTYDNDFIKPSPRFPAKSRYHAPSIQLYHSQPVLDFDRILIDTNLWGFIHTATKPVHLHIQCYYPIFKQLFHRSSDSVHPVRAASVERILKYNHQKREDEEYWLPPNFELETVMTCIPGLISVEHCN